MKKNTLHLDFDRLSQFSPCAQVFAVCTEIKENSAPEAERILCMLLNEIKENSDMVNLCLNFDDLSKSVYEGKIAAIISVEGAEQIVSLESAYSKGVRIIHPVWNYDNEYSGAAMGRGYGLTDNGKILISDAQRMGMLIDVSHMSEKAFWDAAEISDKPIIAGHSDAYALCAVKRNLNDSQFSALVKLGGGVGLNLYPEFLGLGKNIDALVAHAEHFLSLGGEKSVFLGCDFDGVDTLPENIEGVQSLPLIYEAFLKRNYSESLVRDIFWNNLYNIMEKVL